MKKTIERRSLRVLLTMILSVMMAVGGVLPGVASYSFAESGSQVFNTRVYDNIDIFYQGTDTTKAAYCLNKSNSFPEGITFSQYTNEQGNADLSTYLGWLRTDGSVLQDNSRTGAAEILPKIFYLGYGNDAANLMSKNSLTADQFQTMTQLAIWYYTDSYDTTSVDGKENVILKYINEHPTLTVPDSLKIQVWAGVVDGIKKYQNMAIITGTTPKISDDTVVTPAKLKLTAQKKVIDEDNGDADITAIYVNKFDFVLEQTAGPTVLSEPQTKKNASADGKTVTFDEITFDESIFTASDTYDSNGKRSKQFTFKVSENAGGEANIQYSTSSLTKQVTVTETRDATSGDCTFSITIDGTEGSGTVEKDLGTLTNTKKTVTPVKIRLVATKKVAGTYAPAIGEVANKFEFTLSGGGQNQTGKKNDSNGKITFEAMTLNVGQYDYAIRETAGTNGGITYHSGSRNVKIITKEVDGNVVIHSAKMGQGESLIQSGPDAEGVYTLTLPEDKEFTNTYKDPKVTNTTATANGTVATDGSAATVTLDPGEEVNVTLTDSVEFEDFDADRKYIIVSEIYKDGETAAYKSKNTAVSGKSSGTETVTFDNLTAIGKYDIKTKVYYAKADDETMPDMEKPITSATHNDSLNINREKVEIKRNLPKIKISKTDLGYNEIEGASMKLTGGPDNIEEEWESTGEAKEFEVKAGDYVLHETIAPDGYAQVSTEMKFKVNEDGSVELKTTSVDSGGEFRLKEGTTNHIILADARAFDIQISKKVLGGDEVAGAKMLLTGGPDNLTAPWVSTGEPEMFKLRAGDYVLTEEVAPKGLKKVTTKIRFTVTDDGTVANLTATVDNGGKVSVKGDSENHIILEDAPINPDITKTVNGGKNTTMKSEKDTVEFKLTSTVPYGVKEFVFKDNLPEPLLYVEDSINATLGGQDLIQYNPDKGWFGYTATSDTDVVVEVLSTVIDGVEGPSNIPPEEAWGKEVVVTFKCKIDPDADLSDFKDPVVNVANVIVDGVTYTDTGDNKASVLGVYELADDEKDNGKKSKGANTGDDAPIGWAVVGILSAAFALDMMRRRRMNS